MGNTNIVEGPQTKKRSLGKTVEIRRSYNSGLYLGEPPTK